MFDNMLSPFAFFGPFAFYGVMALVDVALAICWVCLWWKIFTKVGWPALLSVLMIWPPAFVLAVVCLAFAKWPCCTKEVQPYRHEGEKIASTPALPIKEKPKALPQ